MQFYTAEQINSKYSSKKSSCNKRNIKFEFTKEEFVSFCNYLNIDSKCAYTNERNKIIESLQKQKVFIEIVDDSCYSCGWITKIEEIQDEVQSN